jgi:uncharacterized metal-binding protein
MKTPTGNVVVIPCSGIGKVYGALSREIAYELAERVRPDTVLLTCLPLLMIADEQATQLVTDNPVITIDGCPLGCAHKCVESRGVEVARTCQSISFYVAHKDLKPDGVAELDETGRKLAAVAADELAPIVDELARGRGQ